MKTKSFNYSGSRALSRGLLSVVTALALLFPAVANAQIACVGSAVSDYVSDTATCRTDQALDNILCVVAAVSGAFVNGSYDPSEYRDCQGEAAQIYGDCVIDASLEFKDDLLACFNNE